MRQRPYKMTQKILNMVHNGAVLVKMEQVAIGTKLERFCYRKPDIKVLVWLPYYNGDIPELEHWGKLVFIELTPTYSRKWVR